MTSSIWGLAKTNPAPEADSAVDFPTKTRFHIALNVKKVEPMVSFYVVLFGTTPHTVREGYAKFDLREPPLNFSLNEVPKNAKGNGQFGIEVKDAQVIDGMVARLQTSTYVWAHTTSQQQSLQVIDPEGNVWRIFGARATESSTTLH